MTAIALAWFVAVASAALPLQIGSPDPPPGGIQLLPGWTHKTEQGIDTNVGSSANFSAKVANDLDIAEVLLIVLSYRELRPWR